MYRGSLRFFPLLALFSACVYAGPIDVSFASSLLSALPGQSVTFSATLTNTTGSVIFLNGDSIGTSGPLITDDLPFFSGFPISLAAGAAASGPVFTARLPANPTTTVYSGTFSILGGSSASALTVQGSAPFAVTVIIPEPGSMVLAGLGLAALMARRRLRRALARNRLCAPNENHNFVF